LEGGYGFLFRSEFFFRTTPELEKLFFLQREARIFFPEFNHGPNKAFLVPDSCRETEQNGNSVSADVTYDTIEND
jgi:hypothetical protein